jgi:glycine betaine/choline ABC-type transport system substrate-binding protein
MSAQIRLRRLSAVLAVLALVFGPAACGGDGGEEADAGDTDANLIEGHPRNRDVRITVGSKNFTEQLVLGEIYAQALEAAGYDVTKRLDLGSEQVALRALRTGRIDAYPEYASTALTSFFGIPAEEVPADAHRAYAESRADFDERGLAAFPPTPFSSANAVGLLTERADELGVTRVSDLRDIAGDLTLAGSPECRERIDCLAGLQSNYGLEFERFTPVDIDRRYDVLDQGTADLSILFTTDARLFVSDDYVILRDDRAVLPPGNVLFVASRETVDRAGRDFAETVKSVQRELSLEVMQELNARVDVDGEPPARAARSYLEEFGYIR